MFKWIKKLFKGQPAESTPAPLEIEFGETWQEYQDRLLRQKHYDLIEEYGFLQFVGDQNYCDKSITDEELVYDTIQNGWFSNAGSLAIRAERDEIVEYFSNLLKTKKEQGFDVIVWRVRPTVHQAQGSDPYRVRLRCAFTTKDKVKPHLLKS